MSTDPTTQKMRYDRADTTLCLSTGRALDCSVRKKHSGAAYPTVTAVGNFIGDGQASVLVKPLHIDQGGPLSDGSLQMCRILGDDTTGGEGTNDGNMVCDPWNGRIDAGDVFFMDLLGTGRMQMVQYRRGQFAGNAWAEDGRWEIFEPVDVAVAGQALDRIVEVRNGLGAVSRVEYADGQSTGIVTQTMRTLPYPLRRVAQTGKIASRLITPTGNGNAHVIDYRYADAALDVTGRGALGYASVKSIDYQEALDDGGRTNSKSGTLTTLTTYAQAWPFTGMTTSEVVTSSDCASTSLSSTTYQLADKAIAQQYGATHFPYVASSTATLHDLDCTDMGTTAMAGADAGGQVQYDNWGNLLNKIETRSANNETFTTTTRNTYYAANLQAAQAGGLVTPQLQTASTTQWQSTDGTQRTRTLDYTYVANSDWPLTETVQAGDASARLSMKLLKSFNRSNNNFGLVGAITETWRDALTNADVSRTNTKVFDANGRYAETQTNALNNSETHAYDPGTGAQTALTGPNGLTTRWSLDAFGQVTKEKRSDGNETRQYRKQCDGACPAGAVMAAVNDTFHEGNRITVPQIVYYDTAGHAIQSRTWGFDGRTIATDASYDRMGRLYETSWPYFTGNSSVPATRRLYDIRNRQTATVTWDENGNLLTSKTQYRGLGTTLTNAKAQSRTETRDAKGRIRQVVDANGKATYFTYDAFDNLATTTDPMTNVVTVTYDDLGRKTRLKDPDLGQIDYTVDALGRTRQQVNPVQRVRGQSTTFDFDVLDRMTARHEPDLESRWVFGTAVPGIGKLAEAYTLASGNLDYDRIHVYDGLGRPSSITQSLFDGTYASKVGYDTWGRPVRQFYQRKTDSQKEFYLRYNNLGYQNAVERPGRMLMTITSQDASSRLLEGKLGNGLVRNETPNRYTGYLDAALLKTAENAIRLQEGYQYDALGSVVLRTQYWDAAGFNESFDYDSLNRLKESTVTGFAKQVFTYDDGGSLKTKTGVGTYAYPAQGATAVRPHAVQTVTGLTGQFQYDDNGNQLAGGTRSASWTSFDMPVSMSKLVNGATRSSSFVYGPEHQRTRQTRQDNSKIIYAGQQEVELNSAGQATIKTYWPQGLGVEIDRPGQPTELNWVHHDRLGSAVAVTDVNGETKEKMAYDAWGKRRTLDGSSTPDELDGATDNKGFTEHEMLDQLDLVHMNGRVYDPYTARFLSGDPLIQDPVNGQNYNRYSYVLNNPTNFTDPTGFACAADTSNPCDSQPSAENVSERGNDKGRDSSKSEASNNTQKDSSGYAKANPKNDKTGADGRKEPTQSGPDTNKSACNQVTPCVNVIGKRPDAAATPGAEHFNSGLFGRNLPHMSGGETNRQHFYSWSVFRCMGNCVDRTFRELKYNPAGSVHLSKFVQTGDINKVSLVGFNIGPILTVVNNDNYTLWNLTLPDHLLYPGWVQRTVFFDGNSTWVNTSGGGDGFNLFNLNTLLAPIVWGGISPARK